MKRNFLSFVEGFCELVRPKGVPPEFATWTALWTISAAVERRVWTFTRGEPLYPNLFIFLISPPGFGKGLTIDPARKLIGALGKDRLSASSMTHASLGDGLRSGKRAIIDSKTQQTTEYYALHVLNTELQVLLPVHDVITLGKITDLYDGKEYSESRRHGGEETNYVLQRVYLTMLGGTTPTHLFETFPESAFETGFFSRTILVWGLQSSEVGDLFNEGVDEENVERHLTKLGQDLRSIAKITGRFSWTEDAKNKANAFYKEHNPYGGSPVPSHPRLLHYCTRRTQHLVKLMMCYNLDRGATDLILREEDYDRAYDTLIATEARMPEIFQQHRQGGETSLVDEIHHTAWIIYQKTGKPITRGQLMRLFGAKVQAFKVPALIEMAVSGGWFQRTTDKKLGQIFTPRASTPSDTERKMK